MTKEELEKEVKEYISYNPTEGSKDFVVYKVRVGENAFSYVVEHENELSMSDWIKMYEGTERECYRVVGYLDSAEPREKRIEELEKQLEISETNADTYYDELTKLQEQLVKTTQIGMTCSNCKWSLYDEDEMCYCCSNKDKWELRR